MNMIEEIEPTIEIIKKQPVKQIDNLQDDKFTAEHDQDLDYVDPNMRSHNWLQ
jgi:hypothetical protein